MRIVANRLRPTARVTALLVAAFAIGALPTMGAVDDSCRVAGADLDRWKQRPDLVIVDVRSEREFRELRIPRSLNIPAFAVRTKSHLRSKPVLLVGGAADSAVLEDRCRELRRREFAQVGFVDGGMAEWARRFGDLLGDRRALLRVALLSPAELVQFAALATVRDRLRIVDLSPRSVAVEDSLRPWLVRVPGVADGMASTVDRLERAVRKHERREPTSVVVLSDADGTRTAALLELVDDLDVPMAYVLDGGIAAFSSYRNSHRRMLIGAENDCESCGLR